MTEKQYNYNRTKYIEKTKNKNYRQYIRGMNKAEKRETERERREREREKKTKLYIYIYIYKRGNKQKKRDEADNENTMIRFARKARMLYEFAERQPG